MLNHSTVTVAVLEEELTSNLSEKVTMGVDLEEGSECRTTEKELGFENDYEDVRVLPKNFKRIGTYLWKQKAEAKGKKKRGVGAMRGHGTIDAGRKAGGG